MPVATTGVGPQLPADKMPPPVSSSSSPPLSAVALEHLGWEELSRHAKHLENTLDSRLLALGRLTSAVLRRHRYDTVIVASRGGDVLRQAEELARSVEEELGRLGAIIEALAARCGEAGGTTLHIMQRHRDIHAEYLKEYRKTREHLRGARETADLYERSNEWNAGRSWTGEQDRSRKDESSFNPQAYLLTEQQRIDATQQHTDHIINVAYAAQSGIHQQRFGILESGRKMQALTDRFPLINQLMMKVRFRRNRDTLIVAALVALFLFLTYLYLSRK